MSGKLIWITGLAGSGKTTIGKAVYEEFKTQEPNSVFLDGDHFREIFGQTNAHTREDRFKVAQQISGLCKFLTAQGINVVCSTISLFKEIHHLNRANNPNYFEIYIYCDMKELMRRDQKNLYTKAMNGEIANVVGVDIAFDEPVNCHLRIDNSEPDNLRNKVDSIIKLINKK